MRERGTSPNIEMIAHFWKFYVTMQINLDLKKTFNVNKMYLLTPT